MKLTRKLNATLVLVVVCLILSIWASYAWFSISRNPEVQRIETNVGANGSLEIALLTDETFQDPTLIKTIVGDSAVKQELLESNKSWGNVIQLEEGYGLDQITLLPARLNVMNTINGKPIVGRNLLKTAVFGVDGRIKVLSDDTVSAVWENNNFTYYVDKQRYGVRAIGTISNLSAQQTSLARARTLTKTYSASATRSIESTWKTYGAGIVDILYRHYALGEDTFSEADANLVLNFANGMLEATEYADGAMRQVVIGMLASQVSDEPQFESLCDTINNPSTRLSVLVSKDLVGDAYYNRLHSATTELENTYVAAQNAVTFSYSLKMDRSWSAFETVLNYLIKPDKVYLGEKKMSETDAYQSIGFDNVILVPANSGVMGALSDYVGNFSAFSNWHEGKSMEARSVSNREMATFTYMQTVLDAIKASVGGWTRANMDDLYSLAIDLAFRCNTPSDLQLQSWAMMRVEEDSEYPVTQGSGSFMQYWSDNMDTEQLINLMDVIRVGFLNDRGEVLSIAKLNLTQYSVDEEGAVSAPLCLYDYHVEESGMISMGARREDNAIMELPENSPVIVTVVVWMDGDHVDNSMVSEFDHQTMNGMMNLQFSSSADLIPSDQYIKQK